MRLVSWLSVLLLTHISSLQIYATEVDSFTQRDQPLTDASDEINLLIQGYLDNALEIANQKKSCKPSVIEKALIGQIKSPFWSKTEKQIHTNEKIQKRYTLFENSIYRDFTMFESPALHMAELGPIIRLKNLEIGTDKIGHFLQTGYEMFKSHHENNESFSAVQDWSEWTEQSYFGLLTTGVYSYGDLAANYDGIYFWERVTNMRLPYWEFPYFECKDGIWSKVALFDINEYVSAAWDEAVNCNSYKNDKMREKVEKRIAELEKKANQRLQCPIHPSLCREIIEKYGNVATHVITPMCF